MVRGEGWWGSSGNCLSGTPSASVKGTYKAGMKNEKEHNNYIKKKYTTSNTCNLTTFPLPSSCIYMYYGQFSPAHMDNQHWQSEQIGRNCSDWPTPANSKTPPTEINQPKLTEVHVLTSWWYVQQHRIGGHRLYYAHGQIWHELYLPRPIYMYIGSP